MNKPDISILSCAGLKMNLQELSIYCTLRQIAEHHWNAPQFVLEKRHYSGLAEILRHWFAENLSCIREPTDEIPHYMTQAVDHFLQFKPWFSTVEYSRLKCWRAPPQKHLPNWQSSPDLDDKHKRLLLVNLLVISGRQMPGHVDWNTLDSNQLLSLGSQLVLLLIREYGREHSDSVLQKSWIWYQQKKDNPLGFPQELLSKCILYLASVDNHDFHSLPEGFDDNTLLDKNSNSSFPNSHNSVGTIIFYPFLTSFKDICESCIGGNNDILSFFNLIQRYLRWEQ